MKNDEQATIKHIAKELNLSASTVSRALRDHPDISEKTKKKVLAKASELDYQPNTVAKSLRNSQTFTIGIVVPSVVHHFFSTIISGIEDVASQKKYKLVIAQSNESFEKEAESVEGFVGNRVDGLFISLASETKTYTHLLAAQRRKIPIVFFDRETDEVQASKIIVDDYDGAFHATEHLITQGCKNIIHLAGPDGLHITENRIRGYLEALKKHNIEKNTIVVSDNFQKGHHTINELLEKGENIDGIFAVNDDTAMGAMRACKKFGKKIPADIAVIGFGDNPIAQIVEPPLSSISQSGFEMGQCVANLFFEQIKHQKDKKNNENIGDYSFQTKVINTKLVIRDSSNRNI